jgi:hypothetical protein
MVDSNGLGTPTSGDPSSCAWATADVDHPIIGCEMRKISDGSRHGTTADRHRKGVEGVEDCVMCMVRCLVTQKVV